MARWLVISGMAGLGLGLGLSLTGAVDLLDDPVASLAADQVSYYDCPDGAALGRLTRGDRVLLTGRDTSGEWVQLRSPQDISSRAWVRLTATVPDDSPDGLPVRSCLTKPATAPPPTTTTTTIAFECAPDWVVDPSDTQFAFAAVRITAEGFTPDSPITIRLDDNEPFAMAQSDGTGAFDTFVNLPDVPIGDYVLTAEDNNDCLIGKPYRVERTDVTTTTTQSPVTTDSTAPTDSTGPSITDVTWTLPQVEEMPESGAPVCPGAPQTIIRVTASDASGIASVQLTYHVGSVDQTVNMALGGGTYNAGVGPFASTAISGFGNSETIALSVRATDNAGNSTVFSPSGGPVLNNCGTT